MNEDLTNYSGTLRIKLPKTLERWVQNGEYQKLLNEGRVFNVGCGRFRESKCTCFRCRKNTISHPLQIVINNHYKPK